MMIHSFLLGLSVFKLSNVLDSLTFSVPCYFSVFPELIYVFALRQPT